METRREEKIFEIDLSEQSADDAEFWDLVSSAVYPGLDRSAKENWVDQVKGLPNLIERVAKHLHYESKYSIGHAIATAVNWCKKMCSTGRAFGGKVKVGKRAQAAACKAVAQWEAKKARAKADNAGIEFPDLVIVNLTYSTITDEQGNIYEQMSDFDFFSDAAFEDLNLSDPMKVDLDESEAEALEEIEREVLEELEDADDEGRTEDQEKPMGEDYTTEGNEDWAFEQEGGISLAEIGRKVLQSLGVDLADKKNVSTKEWSDFHRGDYTDEQWNRATLVAGKLPVLTPTGKPNIHGMRAAAAALAGARGGVKLSPEQRATAERKLKALFNQIGEDPPESLDNSEPLDFHLGARDSREGNHNQGSHKPKSTVRRKDGVDEPKEVTKAKLGIFKRMGEAMDARNKALIKQVEDEGGEAAKVLRDVGDQIAKGWDAAQNAPRGKFTKPEIDRLLEGRQKAEKLLKSPAGKKIPAELRKQLMKELSAAFLARRNFAPPDASPDRNGEGVGTGSRVKIGAGDKKGAVGEIVSMDGNKATVRLEDGSKVTLPAKRLLKAKQDLSEESDVSYQLPVDFAPPESYGRSLYWKRIIKYGQYFHPDAPGGQLKFDKAYGERLVQNFNEGAFESVPLYSVDLDNKHNSLPDRIRGEIKKVEARDDGVYALVETNPEGTYQIEERSPNIGCSVRIRPGYVRYRDMRQFGDSLEHLVFTPKSHLGEMGSWLKTAQADLSEQEGVALLDLTEADFVDPKGGEDMDSRNGHDHEGGEVMTLNLSEIDFSELNDEERKKIMDGLGIQTVIDNAIAPFKEKADENERVAKEAYNRWKTTERRLAEEKLNARLVQLSDEGVPQASIEAAKPILLSELSGQEITVDMTEGDDPQPIKTPVAEQMWKVLEQQKGTVPVEKRELKGETDLTELDADDEDYAAFKAQVGELGIGNEE